MSNNKKYAVTVAGGGSTFTPGIALMLLEERDRFPIRKIMFYDNDAERQEIVAKACEIYLKENAPDIEFGYTTDPETAFTDIDFVLAHIRVGKYAMREKDEKIPLKYGVVGQETCGPGGIAYGMRSIGGVLEILDYMEKYSPNAWMLNYSNPAAIVAEATRRLRPNSKILNICDMPIDLEEKMANMVGLSSRKEMQVGYYGLNHFGWWHKIYDKDGNDLYPEIRRRALHKNDTEKHNDMVRYEYIRRLGYYCTESSEHNAEYNPFFIKAKYPELIDRYQIPLDEYPRRCVKQIEDWNKRRDELVHNTALTHERSREYASYIMEAIVTNKPYKIGGNVLNTGLIDNLPADACVEVPCLVDGSGVTPCHVGRLPVQLAAMNMTNINVQLLTIEAAVTKKRDLIYNAAMLEPHTAAELSIDDIVKMVDELIEAHGDYLPAYH